MKKMSILAIVLVVLGLVFFSCSKTPLETNNATQSESQNDNQESGLVPASISISVPGTLKDTATVGVPAYAPGLTNTVTAYTLTKAYIGGGLLAAGLIDAFLYDIKLHEGILINKNGDTITYTNVAGDSCFVYFSDKAGIGDYKYYIKYGYAFDTGYEVKLKMLWNVSPEVEGIAFGYDVGMGDFVRADFVVGKELELYVNKAPIMSAPTDLHLRLSSGGDSVLVQVYVQSGQDTGYVIATASFVDNSGGIKADLYYPSLFSTKPYIRYEAYFDGNGYEHYRYVETSNDGVSTNYQKDEFLSFDDKTVDLDPNDDGKVDPRKEILNSTQKISDLEPSDNLHYGEQI